jgi:hypothetical protein
LLAIELTPFFDFEYLFPYHKDINYINS